MNISRYGLPALALGLAASFLSFTPEADGFNVLGFSLGPQQRDFRVFNNFTDSTANNNTNPHPNYPGALGATMAIWKACIEWNSTSHGDGTGDPSQPNLGDGGANFDAHFQGEVNTVGGLNDNIHSELAGSNGGVLAFTESPSSNGWRIRYYSGWTWADGPGQNLGFNQIDLQGVACHEYGHALGLAHTGVNGATMFASISGNGISARSIHADDIAGVKAIYGTASAGKPVITGTSIASNQITITGSGFHPTGNRVWFTDTSSGGDGVRVTDVPSSNGGTSITVTIPSSADPGTVIVRNSNNTHASFSNSWPFDPGAVTCPPMVSYCTSAANSVSPFGATIQGVGSQFISDNSFSLQAFDLPLNQNGIFYYGPNQTNLAFGNGFRCVGGTTHRLPIVQSDLFGFVNHNVDFNNPPPNGQITAGSTWNFQFWYRDPAGGGAGFNLTGGLEVTFCN